MKIEVGGPVVLRVVGDVVVFDVLHLPASERKQRNGWRQLAEIADSPGLTLWPTRCGLDGWIYAYGGPLREAVRAGGDRRVCAVCMAAPAVVARPVPQLVPLAAAARGRCGCCGCPRDELTPGCRTCQMRHRARARLAAATPVGA